VLAFVDATASVLLLLSIPKERAFMFAVPLKIRAIKKAASVYEGRLRGLNLIYLPGAGVVAGAGAGGCGPLP
jgi:hypothetical protein